jgi:hypothetical protein
MKLTYFLIALCSLMISCGKDESEEHFPQAKEFEGVYVGKIRDTSGAPAVAVTATAGPGDKITLTWEMNSETGKTQLILQDLYFYEYSYQKVIVFNVGTQTSGEKTQYTYEGERLVYNVTLPPRQGVFELMKEDGKTRLMMNAHVTTPDGYDFWMYMDVTKNNNP